MPAPDPEPAPSDHELPDRRALQRQLWKRYIENIVAKKCHENDPETRLAGFWGRWEDEIIPVANYWRQRLAQIAEKAGVQDFRTHRLRDNSEFRIIPS